MVEMELEWRGSWLLVGMYRGLLGVEEVGSWLRVEEVAPWLLVMTRLLVLLLRLQAPA